MALDENKNNINNSEEENSFNLKEFLHLLWLKKHWIILSVVICTFVAAFMAYRQPRVYGTQAELVILNSNGSGYTGTGIAAFADIKGMTGDVNMFNEMEVIKSPYIVDGVVRRLNLNTTYTVPAFGYNEDLYGISPISVSFLDVPSDSVATILVEKIDNSSVRVSDFTYNARPIESHPIVVPLGKTVKSPIGKIAIGGTINYNNFFEPITVNKGSITATTRAISGNISTTQGPDFTSIIFIDYTDVSEQRATDVVATLIDVYNEMWITEKNRSAINTSNFIKERLAVIEKELSGIDANISEVKSSSQMPDFRAAASEYYNQSMRYDNSSFEASNQLSIARFLKEYLQDPSKANDLIPANSGITNGAVESQIQEYNKLLIKRDNLRQNSSDANPVIIELNNNLASMRGVIVQSIDNLIATTQMKVNESLNRERLYSGRVSAVPTQEKQILSIERQQKVKENLYLYLLQKREENELTGMITVNNTRVIKEATSNGVVAPLRSRYLMMGFAVGLIIPIAILYFLTTLSSTVKTKNDISGLSVPFLGEIPLSSKRRKEKFGTIRHFLYRKSRKLDDEQIEIVVKDRSRSYINEAFRIIRTNLDFLIPSNQKSQVIMTTSFNPRSGKTFVTLNLATTLALKGKKVLVADFDLRRASLSKFIGSPLQGISTYLTGKTVDINQLIIKQYNNSIIDFLPAGAMAPNPSELLLNDSYEKLISELREKYDYIFLDCPPMSLVADTTIISRAADMSIFIMRSGIFDKTMLGDLEKVYKENKLPHLSIILNGINPSESGYGYGYRYGYNNRKHDYYTDDESEN